MEKGSEPEKLTVYREVISESGSTMLSEGQIVEPIRYDWSKPRHSLEFYYPAVLQSVLLKEYPTTIWIPETFTELQRNPTIKE